MNLEKLKYPIGKWSAQEVVDLDLIKKWIGDIAMLPSNLSDILNRIEPIDYELTYRPGSWTVRQLLHHIADSHINAYIRHKLAVSEQTPTINPYNEVLWAEMADVKEVDIKVSLNLLEAIHQRWTVFLNSLNQADLEKSFYHPGHKRFITISESIGMYSWHGKHHLSHIKLALDKPNIS
ncbi:MAG: putative metal-dependent hydrolase [Saprospiraceae bacterium]|nr:putative metal-dependent hydrolase [Candidatus Vicinibacter affinis]